MRSLFRGYYPPTEDEFRTLWQEGTIILDANMLLNIYRYTPTTRDQLLRILRQVSDRLWIPYQAALEYQENRLKVIVRQQTADQEIRKALQDAAQKLKAHFESFKRHPFVSTEELLDRIDAFFIELSQDVSQAGEGHPDLMMDDPLREDLTELLEGKVGSPYSEERLKEVYEEGKKRYAAKIPPGFSDTATKADERQYGDLVLWLQILDYAQQTKKPILYVTDDRKEDWWYRYSGKTLGPHPLLIQEIYSKAGALFYMYSADPFMSYANQYLELQVSQQAIDEVREVRERDEEAEPTSGWPTSAAMSAISSALDMGAAGRALSDLMDTSAMRHLADAALNTDAMRHLAGLDLGGEAARRFAETVKMDTEAMQHIAGLGSAGEAARQLAEMARVDSAAMRHLAGLDLAGEAARRLAEIAMVDTGAMRQLAGLDLAGEAARHLASLAVSDAMLQNASRIARESEEVMRRYATIASATDGLMENRIAAAANDVSSPPAKLHQTREELAEDSLPVSRREDDPAESSSE